jgi:NAD(P)H dehydrogenase (quinone)
MPKILIVYATDHHSTEKMGNAAADGARSVAGTEVTVKKADDTTAEDIAAADGILLGSPVHMGSMDWRMKKLIDTAFSGLWMKGAMNGKVGGVFVSGGGIGGGGAGNEIAIISMLNNFAEMGMVLVPLPLCTPGYADGATQWGPYGRAHNHEGKPVGLTDAQLVPCRHHGANVARVTAALQGVTWYAKAE